MPVVDSKSDVNVGAITLAGSIDFGGYVSGEFTGDFQFFGYRISAAAGASVSLEMICLSSAGSDEPDTTLFVYGPNITPESDALAIDNDSGCRNNAKISDLVLATEGEYLVVVGTANGAGRGAFQLGLTCNSGNCAPNTAELVCSDFSEPLQQCVYDTVNDAHSDADASNPVTQDEIDDAYMGCSRDYSVMANARDFVCSELVGGSPTWCTTDIEVFVGWWFPVCLSEIERLSPSDFQWGE